jgi:hypothetical protein
MATFDDWHVKESSNTQRLSGKTACKLSDWPALLSWRVCGPRSVNGVILITSRQRKGAAEPSALTDILVA